MRRGFVHVKQFGYVLDMVVVIVVMDKEVKMLTP